VRTSLKYQVVAIVIGLVLALFKLAAAFLGPIAFFGTDVLVAAAVGVMTSRMPDMVRSFVLLTGGPVLAVVLLFAVMSRRASHGANDVGSWWFASVLTVALAIAVGALMGTRLSRNARNASA
jgi:hypothetical protein